MCQSVIVDKNFDRVGHCFRSVVTRYYCRHRDLCLLWGMSGLYHEHRRCLGFAAEVFDWYCWEEVDYFCVSGLLSGVAVEVLFCLWRLLDSLVHCSCWGGWVDNVGLAALWASGCQVLAVLLGCRKKEDYTHAKLEFRKLMVVFLFSNCTLSIISLH